MSKSEAQFLEKTPFCCPECRCQLPEQVARAGSAFRCPQCEATLYRALWQSRPVPAGVSRCGACRRALAGEACATCGKRPTWWRRLVQSKWGRWMPRRADRDISLVNLDRLEIDGVSQRTTIDLCQFEGLRQSISEIGLIQPLLVRPLDGERFQVISGHRRLLAMRQLLWGRAPVRVLHVDAAQGARLRLAENRHRESLESLELARLIERVFLSSDKESLADVIQQLALGASEADALLSLLRTSSNDVSPVGFSETRNGESLAEIEEDADLSSAARGDRTERLDPVPELVSSAHTSTSEPREQVLSHADDTPMEDA